MEHIPFKYCKFIMKPNIQIMLLLISHILWMNAAEGIDLNVH